MIPSFFHNHLSQLLLTSILWILATVQAQGNIAVGASLYANEKSTPWKSPSGDFAFGFLQIPDEKDQYLLAIWYNNIPERTIVWYATVDDAATDPATGIDSKVQLINTGLVLQDTQGRVLWRSNLTDDSKVSHAAMLDTGNFVIASESSGYIWESFKYPTDTILPGQELDIGGHLSSALAQTNYRKGKYQVRFNDGSLTLHQVDIFTGNRYDPYFEFRTGSRLIFNKSGYVFNFTPSDNSFVLDNKPRPESYYYRLTLTFDGAFSLYSYPKDHMGGETWSVLWFSPGDICFSFARAVESDTARQGTGPCGYNSLCETIKDGRPNCTCPPGFSLLHENNPYTGCKQDYTGYPDYCDAEGSTIGAERYEIQSKNFYNFPFGDYAILHPATEFECRQSCLYDCSCAVAVFNKNNNGTCWKKKSPLFNGRFEKNNADGTILFKVLKSFPKRNQSPVVLILSVLLGTSATFNFLSLAAITLIFFCLYQRQLRDSKSILSKRDLETNLRSFSYRELEQATNRFKEEIGRGAFGTVFKGVLPSSNGHYVAVKKLEKLAQESEKEFKNEVEVIGQTHHKNLVRLLGFCNEGEHRLLVYEFMGNGSLSSFLFGILRPSWERRLQIASGIAKGLTYLHEECSTQIIHCDIKPQNILLDDSLNAKISDFGLAKLLINNKTQTLTGIRGTKGYVAPEWFRNTPVTVKVDVYSFGVVLLEIICCRKCVHVEMEEAAILTEWAVECYRSRTIEKLVENDEEARSDVGKLEMLLKVAIWCIQEIPSLRPSMRTVTMMLEGAVLVPPPPYPFRVDSMSGSGMM